MGFSQEQRRPQMRGPDAKAVRPAAGPARAAPSSPSAVAPVSPRHGFAAVSPRFGLGARRPGPGAPAAAPANGLPEPLKTNMEAMSGLALDDVRVHRNSSRPAALDALAFAQGAEIHLAAGQDRHLPHEAWHVVQQKQGRVKPTLQLAGADVNADASLEREADRMGWRAVCQGFGSGLAGGAPFRAAAGGPPVAQRVPSEEEKGLLLTRAYDFYTYQTKGDVEFAYGLKGNYRLIRPKSGKAYWRKIKQERRGGRGFYGRLTDKPPTMQEAANYVAMYQAIEQTPGKFFEWTTFMAAKSLGKRKDNNAVMGKYLLGKGGLSASVYALTSDCEWLHMHGHGLGGDETPDNLYAGSNAANSHMAAIEGALQALRSLPKTVISVDVSIVVNEDHHSPENCVTIVKTLGLEGKEADAAAAALSKAPSRMAEHIIYDVLVDGKSVWTEHIDPFVPGRFDEGTFKQLNLRVMAAIKGKPEPIRFVFGHMLTSSPITSASALSSSSSSASSSSSTASVFSGSSSSSSSASAVVSSASTGMDVSGDSAD
jgi:hypothetical protein